MTANSEPLINQQDPSDTSEFMFYELDDGPLNKEQVQAIQELANQQAFTGPTIRKSSLLLNDL